MSNKALGERLKEARELTGLSLIEAAERLGFASYQTLSKIESGEREVKASELFLFTKTYFCNLSSLLGEAELRPSFSPLWRNAPRGNKKKEVEARIFDLCEKYHLLETLLGLQKEEKFKFLDIDIEDIRSDSDIDTLADNSGNLLGLGNRPAFTLQKVLEQKYGVKIIFNRLSDLGSAATMVHPEFGAVVVINADEAPWRRNYDLAHELFHLITWKIISPGDLKDSEFYKDIETKAERFASTFLLPETEVKSEIFSRREGQRGLSHSDLIDIAREFGVSTIAFLYRLKNLRLLNGKTVNSLLKDEELSRLDKHNRGKDWEEKPESERFYLLAIRCLRKGLISRGKFTELVDIDRSEIDEFIKSRGLMETEGVLVEVMAP